MGGSARCGGPVAGAAFFLLLKEVFSRFFYSTPDPRRIIFTLMGSSFRRALLAPGAAS